MSLLACAVFDSIHGRKIKFLTKALRQRKQPPTRHAVGLQ